MLRIKPNYMIGYQEIELLENEYIIKPVEQSDGTIDFGEHLHIVFGKDIEKFSSNIIEGPCLIKLHIFSGRNTSPAFNLEVVKRPPTVPTWMQIAVQSHLAAEADRRHRDEVKRQESQDWLVAKLQAIGVSPDTLQRSQVSDEVSIHTAVGYMRFNHHHNSDGYPSELCAIDTGRGSFTPIKNIDELGKAVAQWFRQHGADLDPLTGKVMRYEGD